MEEIKLIKANLTKKENEIEQIEYNFATASNARVSEICSKQLAKYVSQLLKASCASYVKKTEEK